MMFDVDCPQTPDGNSPKATPNRPPSMARRMTTNHTNVTPRIRSTSYDHGRSRAASYDVPSRGLEPEEMILPSHSMEREPSMYRVTPPTNPSTPPSSNPFDDASLVMNRRRAHSDTWWKEEIVNEREDKGDVLDGYYGLSQKDKQEFYGKSNNPFEEKAVNKHGHTSFQVHGTGEVAVGIGVDQDGSVESSLVERVNPHMARKAAQAVMERADQRQYAAQYGNREMPSSSLYQQATSMRNNGHCQLDDYSFSTINIHSNFKENESPKISTNKGKASIFNMPKWMESFASTKGYTPPEYGISTNITSDTNLAPPIHGNHQDWWSASPKVTFDTEHPDKRSRWNHLSHAQKIGAGVIWVALMCSLMGVTIWSMNKAPEEVYEGNSSSLQGFVPPTSTDAPTTARPTRPPTTRSPVSGYSSLHGKGSTSTLRPSRSPITSRPSHSPVISPTSSPSEAPSVGIELVLGVPTSCSDDKGYFLNHLMNPKDCAWLGNEKEGYTDRKNKNCGNKYYPKTDLGSACRATCALYNGCVSEIPASDSSGYSGISFMSGVASYLTPSQTKSSNNAQICSDDNSRTFKNHLSNDKTCAWLHNDKPGQTERKDKNCGFGLYPITELGQNCPQTCIWYNKSGCSNIKTRSIEPNLRIRTAGTRSTGCVNGSGKYANHHDDHKQCQWLHEPDRPNIEKFRQDKNCGTDESPITDLGTNCPWSCREYNGCSELRN